MLTWLKRMPLVLVIVAVAALSRGYTAQGAQSDGRIDTASLFGVVVGISDYENGVSPHSLERASLRDLAHAHEDAIAFRSMLLDCGVPGANVHLLTNAEATETRLQEELAWLVNTADEASGLIFYYSGHGSGQVLDVDGDENARRPGDRFDEALIPFDALDLYQYDRLEVMANPGRMAELRAECLDKQLTDDEIFGYLSQVEVPFYVVFDSCFSGGAMRAGPVPEGDEDGMDFQCKSPDTKDLDDDGVQVRTMPEYFYPDYFKALLEADKRAGVTVPRQDVMLDLPDNIVLLAACTENQTSLEVGVGGLFTYCLLAALTDPEAQAEADVNGKYGDADGWVDLREAFLLASQAVEEISQDIADQEHDQGLFHQPVALNETTAARLKLAER